MLTVLLNGVTIHIPGAWDELTEDHLIKIAQLAEKWGEDNARFLVEVLMVISDLKIRKVAEGVFQITGKDRGWREYIETHDFIPLLRSVKWLYGQNGTVLESWRTTPIKTRVNGKLYPPAPLLTDISLGEFLLAEDLLYRGGTLAEFMSVLYMPLSRGVRRMRTDEVDLEANAAYFRKCAYTQSPYFRTALGWWWEGTKRHLAGAFPKLFEEGAKAAQNDESLPSDLLYQLAEGNFGLLDVVKRTNLWEAFRLLTSRLH